MAFDPQKTGLAPERIHWFDSIGSTMHEAARLAAQGAPHGTIVGADEQTAGQGRQGHSWHSEKDAGLYVSFLLRLPLAVNDVPMVTLALGLAAVEAITQIASVVPDLRWPNDVLINGKKVCGILTQLHGSAVIAGIGINVNHRQFPPGIDEIATSLSLETSGETYPRERLLANLWNSVLAFTEILAQQRKGDLLRLFEEASSYIRGRRVIVDGLLIGTTAGLNPDGFLILKKDDGTETLILAGGVRPYND